MRSLILALAVAAIAAPVAQAQATSERSQQVRPASSFYSSQAYHALMVRSQAMNTWYRQHQAAYPDMVSREMIKRQAIAASYPDMVSREVIKRQAIAAASVRHADDRAGVRGPGIVQTPQVVSSPGNAFEWGDASIGAGVALGGAIVLIGGLALSRRHRTEPLAV